jgi:spore coat polysaccharide biosynthesis protein SpsF
MGANKPESKKIVATIEARMTSNRFPGKVLQPLGGMPALEFMIRRIQKSRLVGQVVVACTINRDDDPIEALCRKIGCGCHRGSEDDVLKRVLDAATEYRADLIVELTGDCPFIDPQVIDQVIGLYLEAGVDYASNVVERSYPDGFDVQVFSIDGLRKADTLTKDPIDRIHVSSYFYRTEGVFTRKTLKAPAELDWPELGLTLDEPDDYRMLCAVADALGKKFDEFTVQDVVKLLRQRPDLLEINSHVRRKTLEEG